MSILKNNKQNRNCLNGSIPTVSDLHEFPDVGIHRHIFNLALFLKNWSGESVSPDQAVDLIKSKFYLYSQRRDLQSKEVENAVEKAFNFQGIRRVSTGKVFLPKRVMTSPTGIWPRTLQQLAITSQDNDSIRKGLDEYSWSVEEMEEASPIKGSIWSSLDILGMLYEPDDLICSGTFYVPKTRPLNNWVVEGLTGDLFCPNPMRTENGVNLSGKISPRCRDNVGKRKYLVYECDDKSLDFDQKATLILCLREKTDAKLRMVVHSGGKSLHAFFDASGNEEDIGSSCQLQ